MSGAADSEAKALAAQVGERLAEVSDAGRQLGLFGEPQRSDQGGAEPRGPGRPAGARNKAKLGLAEYMAAMGYRAPAQQLAFIAGLAQSELDALETCMARAELVAAWAGLTSPAAKATLFLSILKEMRLAADAILPYTAARLQPETPPEDPTKRLVIGMMGGGDAGSAGPRRIGPPPMPSEIRERNQDVSEAADIRADGRSADE